MVTQLRPRGGVILQDEMRTFRHLMLTCIRTEDSSLALSLAQCWSLSLFLRPIFDVPPAGEDIAAEAECSFLVVVVAVDCVEMSVTVVCGVVGV